MAKKIHEISFSELALALSDDYESVFVIDSTNDNYVEYVAEGGDKELSIRMHGDNFFEDVPKNAREMVWPEDRQIFIKAFKKNFWPATKAWIVLLVIIGALFLQYTYVTNNDTQMASYLMILLGFEMLVVSLIVPFVFPLVARYENTTFNYIKNSFILSIMNIKEWLFVFFHFFLPFLIYYVNPTIFHYSWYLWLVILFCIFGYSKCIVMWKIFDKLEKKPEKNE